MSIEAALLEADSWSTDCQACSEAFGAETQVAANPIDNGK